MKMAAIAALLLFSHAGTQPGASAASSGNACAVGNEPVAVSRCEPASIYVADFDSAAIQQILSRHFDGFTILPARGCWHKVCEKSVVIQIAGATEIQVRKAAEELRVAGKQESVLVVLPPRPVSRR